MFNPRVWQIIIIVLAGILVPTVIIPAASELITQGVQSAGSTINEILRPLSQRGDARLEGLVRLCLYLIFITVVVRFIIGRKP